MRTLEAHLTDAGRGMVLQSVDVHHLLHITEQYLLLETLLSSSSTVA